MAGFVNHWLDRAVGRVERAEALDRVSAGVSGVLTKPLSWRPVKDLLSGTPAGHPVHPLVVTVPLGAWLAAAYLDWRGGDDRADAARALVGAGLITAAPATVTGASDWLYTTGAEQRVGLVHAATNYTSIGLFAASWWARRTGRVGSGQALTLAGLVGVSLGGWLGGHLVYARGVGVDTTAFQAPPTDWCDVAIEADLVDGRPTLVHADALPVLLLRTGATIEAISDRCTHRGAPLHEGTIEGDCVVCPWHGSRFRLSDGQVVEGPASRSQQHFEVRVHNGSVQVRQPDEPGSLRLNPVA